MRRAAAIAALLVATARADPPPAPAAFVGVTVIPMDRPGALVDQTVLVDGGQITVVGPRATVAVPPGAQRIDGQGRFLLPALADLHAHLDSAAALELTVLAGVTTVRNMWGTPLHLLWRRQIAAGDRFGPTIVTAGPILDGEPPVWSGSRVVARPEEAAAAVDEQLRAGYDLLKVYNNLTPAVFAALAAAARARHVDLVGHVPTRVGLLAALPSLRTIEHLTGYLVALQRETSPFYRTSALPHRRHLALHVDPAKIPIVVRETARAGNASCPTLTVDSWFVPPERIAALEARDEMRWVAPWVRASWRQAVAAPEPAVEYEDEAQAEEILRAIVRALFVAGVRILVGTDSPNPYVVPGFAVHDELANLVRAGLTPWQALRAATVWAADLLGGGFGAVRPGLRADLLLLDGDPTIDIAATRRRAGVMVRGRWLPSSEVERRLESLAASYLAPADRFAGAPPVDERREGTLVWRGAWSEEMAGVPFGAERAAIDQLPDGTLLIRAQSATAAPDAERLSLRLEAGERRNGRSLILDGARPEGRTHVELTRQTGQLRAHGSTPFQPPIDLTLPITDDTLLAAPLLADDLLLFEKLHHLGPGESRYLRAVSVELSPELELLPALYRVERLPAGRYLVELHRARSITRQIVTLGSDGLPAQVEVDHRGGAIDFRRR